MTYLFMQRPMRSLTAALLCTSVAVSGCSTTGGSPLSAISGSAQYNDAGDPCNQFREPLRASKDYFAQTIIESAAIGAVTGAATGLLVGILSGGDKSDLLKRTAIGAGVGAAGGIAAGYLKAKRQEVADQQALEAAIRGDAGADSSRLQTFATAMDSMHFCRVRQMETLRAQALAGEIDKTTLDRRLDFVEAQIRQDDALIEDVLGKAFERNKIYAVAFAETTGTTEDAVLAPVQTYLPTVVTQPITFDPLPVYESGATYETVAIDQSVPVAPAPVETVAIAQPTYEAVSIDPAQPVATVPIQPVPQPGPTYENVSLDAAQPVPEYRAATPAPVQVAAPVQAAPQPVQVAAPKPVQVAAVPPQPVPSPRTRSTAVVADEAEYDARRARARAQAQAARQRAAQQPSAAATVRQASVRSQGNQIADNGRILSGLQAAHGSHVGAKDNLLASLRGMDLSGPPEIPA